MKKNTIHKNLLFISILIMVAVVLPASALHADVGAVVATVAVDSGDKIYLQDISTQSTAAVCGAYGKGEHASPSPYHDRNYLALTTALSSAHYLSGDKDGFYPAYIINLTDTYWASNPNYIYAVNYVICSDYNAYASKYYHYYNSSTYIPVPGINFTASPTYGFLPLQIQFTGTSNVTNSIWLWNYGDGQSLNSSISNPVHTYTLPGIYTVRMDAYSASYGWYNLTRTNYITATNPSGVVFNVDIKDSISGALIQDSSVGIRNTTSGVWRNGTAPTGLIYYDTTDPGYLYPLSVNQSVTIAANKTGYQSASSTFNIPYDNYRAFLYLVPSSVVNATGTGTVVATVVRNVDGLPLSGTTVTLSTGQMGVTNSAGAVTLRNVTAGTPSATALNSGYQTTTSTFTLSAGETKMIIIQMVRDGETPVTTFGSPTPTRTPGPGDPGYAGVNTSSGALNERGSTGLMEMMGQLIDLWPLVLIILFMKFMKDAFS